MAVPKRKMPPKPDAKTVIAEVTKLFNQPTMQAYRAAHDDYAALTLLRKDSGVPDDYSKGVTGEVHSTRILRVGTTMKNKAAGYPVYTDVYPSAVKTGVPTNAMVDKADKVGRALAICRAEMDAGLQVTSPTRDWQFYAGWTVWHLKRRDRPGRGFSMEIEVCDPRTVAVPEIIGKTYRPKRLARRYRILMSKIKDTYGGKGKLSLKSGIVGWEPIADSRAITDAPLGFGKGAEGKEDDDQELELSVYDDGYWITHVVHNAPNSMQKDSGQVVFCTENTTYRLDEDGNEVDCGASAVVVPGMTLAIGGDGEHMLPVLWALQNIVYSRNLVNDLRMSTALRGRPGEQIVLRKTPEYVEAQEKLGTIRPTATPEESDALIVVTGDSIHAWEVKANEDLDKIDAMLRDDEEKAVAEMTAPTNPEVVAQATASGIMVATGEIDAQQTTWLQYSDFAWAESLQMVVNDMVNNEDEYSFVSHVEVPRSGAMPIKQGEATQLSASDIDPGFRIVVSTKQETEDQKAKRMMNALFLQSKGVRTLIDVIEADTTDVTARVRALRADYARRLADPVLLLKFFPAMLNNAIKTRAGIDLAIDQQPQLFLGGRGGGSAPSGVPGQTTFAPAPTNGAQGALEAAPA